jgi:hypothetical protein
LVCSLVVDFQNKNHPTMVGSRVYVGGLPYGTRERDLEKFFKGYGRTRDILIKNGYGFVEFEDYRDADDAVYELNGKEILGERQVLSIFSYHHLDSYCYQCVMCINQFNHNIILNNIGF